jgi:ribosomal protein S18 acetylase RimI-like enzyme
MLKNLIIKPVEVSEVPLISQFFKESYGRSHINEVDDQERGILTFLVAWHLDVPLGCGFINWGGPRSEQVARMYGHCPEVYRLDVRETFQSQGIGTRLIGAFEEAASSGGLDTIGLGVWVSNTRVLALYKRLGFGESDAGIYMDRYQFVDRKGIVRTASEPCTYFIKPLSV